MANSIVGERKAAVLYVISYAAYINKMVRGVRSTDHILMKEARIHFKLAEYTNKTCGNLKL